MPNIFKGHSFYLDLNGYGFVTDLEKDIESLGGKVESFLSREVKYVVTNRRGSLAGSPSVTDQSSPGMPSKDSPHSTQSPLALTRGRALLLKASKSQQGNPLPSQDVLTRAKEWGIKTLHLSDVQRKVDKEKALWECPRDGGSTKQKKRRSSGKKSASVKHLSGNYMKFENVSGKHRPCYEQFSGSVQAVYIPAPDEEGVTGSPFENPARQQQQATAAKASKAVKPAASTPAPAATAKKHIQYASGYCECCQMKYKGLKEHFQSQTHLKFIKCKDNFSELDTTINKLPTLEDFCLYLSKEALPIERKTKETSLVIHDENAMDADISPNNSAICENPGLKSPNISDQPLDFSSIRHEISPSACDSQKENIPPVSENKALTIDNQEKTNLSPTNEKAIRTDNNTLKVNSATVGYGEWIKLVNIQNACEKRQLNCADPPKCLSDGNNNISSIESSFVNKIDNQNITNNLPIESKVFENLEDNTKDSISQPLKTINDVFKNNMNNNLEVEAQSVQSTSLEGRHKLKARRFSVSKSAMGKESRLMSLIDKITESVVSEPNQINNTSRDSERHTISGPNRSKPGSESSKQRSENSKPGSENSKLGSENNKLGSENSQQRSENNKYAHDICIPKLIISDGKSPQLCDAITDDLRKYHNSAQISGEVLPYDTNLIAAPESCKEMNSPSSLTKPAAAANSVLENYHYSSQNSPSIGSEPKCEELINTPQLCHDSDGSNHLNASTCVSPFTPSMPTLHKYDSKYSTDTVDSLKMPLLDEIPNKTGVATPFLDKLNTFSENQFLATTDYVTVQNNTMIDVTPSEFLKTVSTLDMHSIDNFDDTVKALERELLSPEINGYIQNKTELSPSDNNQYDDNQASGCINEDMMTVEVEMLPSDHKGSPDDNDIVTLEVEMMPENVGDIISGIISTDVEPNIVGDLKSTRIKPSVDYIVDKQCELLGHIARPGSEISQHGNEHLQKLCTDSNMEILPSKPLVQQIKTESSCSGADKGSGTSRLFGSDSVSLPTSWFDVKVANVGGPYIEPSSEPEAELNVDKNDLLFSESSQHASTLPDNWAVPFSNASELGRNVNLPPLSWEGSDDTRWSCDLQKTCQNIINNLESDVESTLSSQYSQYSVDTDSRASVTGRVRRKKKRMPQAVRSSKPSMTDDALSDIQKMMDSKLKLGDDEGTSAQEKSPCYGRVLASSGETKGILINKEKELESKETKAVRFALVPSKFETELTRPVFSSTPESYPYFSVIHGSSLYYKGVGGVEEYCQLETLYEELPVEQPVESVTVENMYNHTVSDTEGGSRCRDKHVAASFTDSGSRCSEKHVSEHSVMSQSCGQQDSEATFESLHTANNIPSDSDTISYGEDYYDREQINDGEESGDMISNCDVKSENIDSILNFNNRIMDIPANSVNEESFNVMRDRHESYQFDFGGGCIDNPAHPVMVDTDARSETSGTKQTSSSGPIPGSESCSSEQAPWQIQPAEGVKIKIGKHLFQNIQSNVCDQSDGRSGGSEITQSDLPSQGQYSLQGGSRLGLKSDSRFSHSEFFSDGSELQSDSVASMSESLASRSECASHAGNWAVEAARTPQIKLKLSRGVTSPPHNAPAPVTPKSKTKQNKAATPRATSNKTPKSSGKLHKPKTPSTPASDAGTLTKLQWRVQRSGDCKLTFSTKKTALQGQGLSPAVQVQGRSRRACATASAAATAACVAWEEDSDGDRRCQTKHRRRRKLF